MSCFICFVIYRDEFSGLEGMVILKNPEETVHMSNNVNRKSEVFGSQSALNTTAISIGSGDTTVSDKRFLFFRYFF